MFTFLHRYYCLHGDEVSLRMIQLCEGDDKILPFYFYAIFDKNGQNVGRISIRIGDNFHSYYNGHIGYEVEDAFRGRGYALHASRLVLQVAKAHGMERIYITCKVSNAASRRVMEKLGASLVEIAAIPPECFFYREGIEKYAIYTLAMPEAEAEELGRMGIAYTRMEEMRNKDGVRVLRVFRRDGTAVLKCFDKPEYRREIQNYNILRKLKIPTLKVFASTDKALLLEDINQSSAYRLAEEVDLSDETVARAIAKWYKTLHDKGALYVKNNASALYAEADCLTVANFVHIAHKTGTEGFAVWERLATLLPAIRAYIDTISNTLNYNDFYYTNMAVARDGGTALTFDYNLLGRGYVYADIRNVCCSLCGRAKDAFMEAYGAFDEKEKLADDVAAVLVTLHAACRFENLPAWAESSLSALRDGTFAHALDALAAFIGK